MTQFMCAYILSFVLWMQQGGRNVWVLIAALLIVTVFLGLYFHWRRDHRQHAHY